MQTIHKFTLLPGENNDIHLPADAEILTVQNQNNKICMWVKLDKSAPRVFRKFSVLGTGWDIVSNYALKYIGTVQLEDGGLVFHIFELVGKTEINKTPETEDTFKLKIADGVSDIKVFDKALAVDEVKKDIEEE